MAAARDARVGPPCSCWAIGFCESAFIASSSTPFQNNTALSFLLTATGTSLLQPSSCRVDALLVDDLLLPGGVPCSSPPSEATPPCSVLVAYCPNESTYR